MIDNPPWIMSVSKMNLRIFDEDLPKPVELEQ